MSVLEENWNIQFNLHDKEENSYKEFEDKLNSLHEHILDLIENGFKVHKYKYNGNAAQNHDDELKTLMEQNKQLRHDIDNKLEALAQQKIQYENYKKDQRLLSQEIKETHEAFLMAKKYYKKFLKMYYTIELKSDETQTIFVQFFTEAKKESENYSVRLLRNTKSGSYQLLNVTPKLHIYKELQQKLQETNDVPSALCCIRQAFMNIKMNKALCNLVRRSGLRVDQQLEYKMFRNPNLKKLQKWYSQKSTNTSHQETFHDILATATTSSLAGQARAAY